MSCCILLNEEAAFKAPVTGGVHLRVTGGMDTLWVVACSKHDTAGACVGQ